MFLRVILFCWLGVIQALKMPDFVPTCQRSDPKLNECAKINGNNAIKGIVKGDRSYQLPSMSPLKIPKIDIHAGNNLRIVLEDNEVSGLEDTIVTDADLQLDKQHMVFKVFIPRANIKGKYTMDGHILILPIKGEGPANITFMNGHYDYSMDYTMKTGKDGKEYLTITDHKIDFNTSRAYYKFKNLFGGNGGLGKQMNTFLNENWEAVTKDMGATVAETISSIITSLARSIFSRVPYEEVLPP